MLSSSLRAASLIGPPERAFKESICKGLSGRSSQWMDWVIRCTEPPCKKHCFRGLQGKLFELTSNGQATYIWQLLHSNHTVGLQARAEIVPFDALGDQASFCVVKAKHTHTHKTTNAC